MNNLKEIEGDKNEEEKIEQIDINPILEDGKSSGFFYNTIFKLIKIITVSSIQFLNRNKILIILVILLFLFIFRKKYKMTMYNLLRLIKFIK